MTDDKDCDAFNIPSFLKREHTIESESKSMKSVSKEAETEADEAPAKAPKRAKRNGTHAAGDAAKAKGKGKRKRAAPDEAKFDRFGFRLSSIKSKAAALYAREEGATLGEVREELDSTQFNLLKEVRVKGFTIKEKKEDGNGNRKTTRYFIQE